MKVIMYHLFLVLFMSGSCLALRDPFFLPKEKPALARAPSNHCSVHGIISHNGSTAALIAHHDDKQIVTIENVSDGYSKDELLCLSGT